MQTMKSLAQWLNKSLLPHGTSTTQKAGYYAVFFSDGQLQHFGCYQNGLCDYGWHLELEHGAESGRAQLNSGSGGTPDCEIYIRGQYSPVGAWSTNDRPVPLSYQEWVVGWIKKIVDAEKQNKQSRQTVPTSSSSPVAGVATGPWPPTKEGAKIPKAKTSVLDSVAGAFPCPNCTGKTMQIIHRLQLKLADWDESQIQLLKCPGCAYHAMAWYERSGEGGNETVQHKGFRISSTYWRSMLQRIGSCPSPTNPDCSCYSHIWLAQQGKFNEISEHQDWFNLQV